MIEDVCLKILKTKMKVRSMGNLFLKIMKQNPCPRVPFNELNIISLCQFDRGFFLMCHVR